MHTETGSGERNGVGWIRYRRARVIGLAVGVLAVASSAAAQETPATAPAASQSAGLVPQELAAVPGIQPGMTVSELLEIAAQATEDKRLSHAEQIMTYVTTKEPENLEALGRLAYLYELRAAEAKMNTSEPRAIARAEAYLNAAVKTYLYAAPLALDDNKPDVAQQMYNAVKALRPGEPQVQLGLGRVFRATQQNLQAIERYRAYIKSVEGEQDSQAHLELGQVYRTGKYLRAAISVLQTARKLNPENPEILMELAIAYVESGDSEKAVDLAQAAVSRAPRDAEYHGVYALVLVRQSTMPGTEQEARRNLELARSEAQKARDLALEDLRAKPDDERRLSSLSRHYETYRTVLSNLLEKDQSDVSVRIELAKAMQERAAVDQTLDLHRALRVLLAAAEQGRNRAERILYLETLAQLQYDVHKHPDAAQTCRRLIEEDSQSATARRILDSLPADIERESSD